jgi:NTP pyrophosphatase (non-canonical NTP hydrolase)
MGRQSSKVLVGMENEEVGEVGEKVEKGKETNNFFFP